MSPGFIEGVVPASRLECGWRGPMEKGTSDGRGNGTPGQCALGDGGQTTS